MIVLLLVYFNRSNFGNQSTTIRRKSSCGKPHEACHLQCILSWGSTPDLSCPRGEGVPMSWGTHLARSGVPAPAGTGISPWLGLAYLTWLGLGYPLERTWDQRPWKEPVGQTEDITFPILWMRAVIKNYTYDGTIR